MIRSKLVAALPVSALPLLLAGCGGADVHTPPRAATASTAPVTREATVDPEAFRAHPPAPAEPRAFTLPAVEEAHLANGMRILVARGGSVPLVGVRILSDHGASQAAPGLADLAASLLEGGTKRHEATKLAEAWQALGGSHGAAASHDAFTFSFDVLASRAPEAMSLAAEVLRTSTAPEVEVERARRRHVAALLQEQDDPQSLSNVAVGATLFGVGHPFAVPVSGTLASMRSLRASDVRGFFRDHVQPNRMTVAFAGPLTLEEAKALAEKAFGDWRGAISAPDEKATPERPAGTEARIVLVDKEGLSQSTVTLADLGISRSNPDFLAVQTMAMVLGGSFSSRINLNLREAHEYTYGAWASFQAMRSTGTFEASGAIVGDKTAPAIVEIQKEIERIRENGVNDEELALAKVQLTQNVAEHFRTVAATSWTLAGLAELGLPKDEYVNRAARLAAITKDDVLRVARTYLAPDRMRVVVVGDAKVVANDLANLGLGPVELRSPAHPAVPRRP